MRVIYLLLVPIFLLVSQEAAATQRESVAMLAGAISHYQKFVEEERADPALIYRLGMLHMLRGSMMVESFSEIETRKELAASESEAFSGSRDLEQGVDLFEMLLKNAPDYIHADQAAYQAAHALWELGKEQESAAMLGVLINNYPESGLYAEALLRHAEWLFGEGRYLEAARDYAVIIEQPMDSRTYYHTKYRLAQAYLAGGEPERAQQVFESLLNDVARTPEPAGVQRDELVRRDKYDELTLGLALSVDEESRINGLLGRLMAASDGAYIVNLLAGHFWELDKRPAAVHLYEHFMELFPTHPEAAKMQRIYIDMLSQSGDLNAVVAARQSFHLLFPIGGEYWGAAVMRDELLRFAHENVRDLGMHFHMLAGNQEPASSLHTSLIGQAKVYYEEYLRTPASEDDAEQVIQWLSSIYSEAGEYTRAANLYRNWSKGFEADDPRYIKALSVEMEILERGIHSDSQHRTELVTAFSHAATRYAACFVAAEHASAALAASVGYLLSENLTDEAQRVSRLLLDGYPEAAPRERLVALLVLAEAAFQERRYADAESFYHDAKSVFGHYGIVPEQGLSPWTFEEKLERNLASSIYEQARAHREGNHDDAALDLYKKLYDGNYHEEVKGIALYDAGTLLMEMQQWEKAIDVLHRYVSTTASAQDAVQAYRHLAQAYHALGDPFREAESYASIASLSPQESVRRDALILAANLYSEQSLHRAAVDLYEKALSLRRADSFSAEDYFRILGELAASYGAVLREEMRMATLRRIVEEEGALEAQRSPVTRRLAGEAALAILEPEFIAYQRVRLVQPIAESLSALRATQQTLFGKYQSLLEYRVKSVSSTALNRMAHIQMAFADALRGSERPKSLDQVQLSEYDNIINQRADPFRQYAVRIFEQQLDAMGPGYYDDSIADSLVTLGRLVPALYARSELSEDYVTH